MSDNKLEKKSSSPIKEKGQYVLAFGVVASMLLVAGFPVFVVFFFGVFAFLLFKMFASSSRSETREIFEFYLSANEILRDDERRWFGFEIKDVIQRGELVARRMSPAPPLVHFALGALQNKVGDHNAAIGHLTFVVENEKANEAAIVHPTAEMRNYVRILRKIERDPADAPLTSAAIRALERARRLRGETLLEESRSKIVAVPEPRTLKEAAPGHASQGLPPPEQPTKTNGQPSVVQQGSDRRDVGATTARESKKTSEDQYSDRKPISEVLHDIYDRNLP